MLVMPHLASAENMVLCIIVWNTLSKSFHVTIWVRLRKTLISCKLPVHQCAHHQPKRLDAVEQRSACMPVVTSRWPDAEKHSLTWLCSMMRVSHIDYRCDHLTLCPTALSVSCPAVQDFPENTVKSPFYFQVFKMTSNGGLFQL